MDRGVVPTNQNPRLTRLRQPRSVRGDREGRIGSSWVSMIGVQVHSNIMQVGEVLPHGQTEFYKFHTGSDVLVQITGSGKNWIVAWQGVSISITTTEKDAVMEPFRHQAIHIRAVDAVRGMTMTTDLAVDRAVTQ